MLTNAVTSGSLQAVPQFVADTIEAIPSLDHKPLSTSSVAMQVTAVYKQACTSLSGLNPGSTHILMWIN